MALASIIVKMTTDGSGITRKTFRKLFKLQGLISRKQSKACRLLGLPTDLPGTRESDSYVTERVNRHLITVASWKEVM